MRVGTMWRRGLVLIGVVALGCGDSGSDPLSIEVTAALASLVVIDDCDDGGLAEGDFFLSTSIGDVTTGEDVRLDEVIRLLVQSNPNRVVTDFDASASGLVPAVTGTRVIVRASFFENDSGGPQVSVGQGFIFEYDASRGCWQRDGEPDCFEEGGVIDTGQLILSDFTGDACNALLRWQFIADEPM